jgi:hypothetical protein
MFPTRAPWLEELEAELFSFPGSRLDDQVDSISQVINYARSSRLWRFRKWGKMGPISRPSPMGRGQFLDLTESFCAAMATDHAIGMRQAEGDLVPDYRPGPAD